MTGRSRRLALQTVIVSTLGTVARPWLIPALTFVMGALVAFSTGTSWGTMGILIPTLMPFAFYMGGMPTLILSMGAVLDGAIFGDHCSPISDTTVLSRSRWPDHGLFARGANRLYVHRGTGFYGFPLRVGVPGELSVLELVPEP